MNHFLTSNLLYYWNEEGAYEEFCFSDDSKDLLVVTSKGTHIYDLNNGEKIGTLINVIFDLANFKQLDISRCGTLIAEEDSGNMCNILIRNTITNTTNLLSSINRVIIAKFSNDATRLASSCLKNNIYIWNIDNNQLIQTLIGNKSYIYNLKFFDNLESIVSNSCDEFFIWNIEHGEKTEIKPFSSIAMHVDVSKDSKFIVYSQYESKKEGNPNYIVIYDVLQQKRIWEIQNDGSKLDCSPTDNVFATTVSYNDYSVEIFNIATGAFLRRFSHDGSAVSRIRFSPNGNYVVLGTFNDEIFCCNLLPYKLLAPICCAMFKAHVSLYVVLDILNFILASDAKIPFCDESEFLHCKKIVFISKLTSFISNCPAK